ESPAGRTMWLLPALLLLIIPGCFSMSGPWSVSGPRGGSATIQCRYDPGWESYSKWWCRGESWGSCDTLLKTTGSEWKVQSGRMSIQDDHWRHRFTVTIEELRASDEDVYWCGIEKASTPSPHSSHHSLVGSPKSRVRLPSHPGSSLSGLPSIGSLPCSSPSPSFFEGPTIAPSYTIPGGRPRWFLLCNLHVVLLTVIKVPLLGCLLCTLMWLSRSQGDPK
uniref:Immunoglobulin V-set domain-containing protein n=1 Tax=Myotis lucifugus TaxID=59463 RepID=G1P3V6_MYOLU